jgi:hypothetical protein
MSWRWLLVLVLPFGSLIVVGEYLRRRWEQQQQPTLVADWRRFMKQPVIIRGRLRQPKLRKIADRPATIHAVRKTGTR